MMTSLAFEFAAGAAPLRVAALHAAPRVLWIDADENAIEPSVEMLRRHGYEVECAGSALEAQPTLDRGTRRGLAFRSRHATCLSRHTPSLAREPGRSRVPVIVSDARASSIASVWRARADMLARRAKRQPLLVS